MKRVAFYIPVLGTGGAERVLLNLANQMANMGYSVHIIVATDRGNTYKTDLNTNIKLYFVGSSRPFRVFLYLRNLYASGFYEWIITGVIRNNILLSFSSCFKKSKTKLLLTVHNTYSKHIIKDEGKVKGTILKFLINLSYNYSDKIVAVSDGAATDLIANFRVSSKKTSRIYNPVVSPSILEKSKEPVDHPWFNGEYKVIMGVGRLTYQKNFELLIKSFSKIEDKKFIRLIILGDGVLKDQLENLIDSLNLRSYAAILDFDPNPFKYLSKCDLFVLSSNWEGLPTVLIEAMYLGIPVISTKCPSGPSEILNSGEFGMMVEINDMEAMKQSIISALINYPVDLRKLIDRSSIFSTDIATKQYIDLMNI